VKIFSKKRLLREVKRHLSKDADLAATIVVTEPSRYRTIRFEGDYRHRVTNEYLLFPATCFGIDVFRTSTGFKFKSLKFGILKNENSKIIYYHRYLPNIGWDGSVCMENYLRLPSIRYADTLVSDVVNYFWNSSFFVSHYIGLWKKIEDVNDYFCTVEGRAASIIGRIPPDSKQIFPRKWARR